MKFSYCPSCGKAYKKTRFERDRCIGCGKAGTKVVDVKSNIFYYLTYVTFILGAAVIYFMREYSTRWVIFFGFLIAGAFMAVGGMSQMRLNAMEMGKEQSVEVEKKKKEKKAEKKKEADFTCTNCDGDAWDDDKKCRHCGEPFDDD